MACEQWRDKIEAYIDGELSSAEEQAFDAHRRGCASCAAEAAERIQWKNALRRAATRHVPSPAFRRRVEQSIVRKRKPAWRGRFLPAFAAVAIVVIATVAGVARWEVVSRQRTLQELADLHVATLASSTPVDVVSTDRHTVKPWFAGRIPFSFDLPDLSDSPFSLLGGRVAFLHQEAGAQLLFQIRQHHISVFIFPDRNGSLRWLGREQEPTRQAAFTVETWTVGGLRYFAISDVGAEDLHHLAELMRQAAR